MLENSYGLTFFLKSPRKAKDVRVIYARVTVDGVPKEKSTNEKWDINRWDQKLGRAIGHKEDARVLNNFLDSLENKITNKKTELLNLGKAITAEKLIMVINGRIERRNKVLEEFKEHNDEIKALADVGELSKATYAKYEKAKDHVSDFMMFKYKVEDMEFVDLDFSFINSYDLYLRTEKACNNNTTLKYISNFKKVVLRAIDKEMIKLDPFRRFKRKRTKANKRPISSQQLYILETKKFSTERLSVVRDMFVFQCYTGLKSCPFKWPLTPRTTFIEPYSNYMYGSYQEQRNDKTDTHGDIKCGRCNCPQQIDRYTMKDDVNGRNSS